MRHLPILLLFAAGAAGFAACRNGSDGPATVVFRADGLTDADEIEILDNRRRISAFQTPPIVAGGVVDSAGRFEATIDLDTPGPYWLRAGRRGTVTLYLHPGQRLEVSVDPSAWRNTLAFSGDHAVEQEVFGRIQTAGWQDAPTGLDTLTAGQFSDAARAFEERYRKLVEEELASHDVTDAFRRYATAWADTRLYFTRSNYEFAMERRGLEAGLPDDLFNPEAILRKHRDLIEDVPELRSLAVAPIRDSIRMFVREDPPLDSDIEWQTDYWLRRIEEGPDDFRRPYLYAAALVQYVALGGTTPRVDSVVALYADRLTPYDRSVLDAEYASFKALEGRPAPDFEFLLPDSTRMRLSDLRGKVVYVDVWATWCGPCLVEMPFSNQLRERYRDRDDLVFLYVSVDDDTDAWYRMLSDRTDFGGLHGITGIGWDGPLTQGYRINGIPRSILVDRDGSLVRVSAPSPSSDAIVPLLDRMLG